MKRQLLAGLCAAVLTTVAATQAGATVVFSDNFNDNDVSDWSFSTNYEGGAGLDAGGILGPYINAPPGRNSELIARGSRTINLTAGSYALSLDALSVPCSGCTISYDVLFDNALLTRTASNGAWQSRSFDLGALSAGSHTITLGMHTTLAFSGHFLAQFDNVVLDQTSTGSSAPEPGIWAMMLIGFGGVGSLLRRRARILA